MAAAPWNEEHLEEWRSEALSHGPYSDLNRWLATIDGLRRDLREAQQENIVLRKKKNDLFIAQVEDAEERLAEIETKLSKMAHEHGYDPPGSCFIS